MFNPGCWGSLYENLPSSNWKTKWMEVRKEDVFLWPSLNAHQFATERCEVLMYVDNIFRQSSFGLHFHCLATSRLKPIVHHTETMSNHHLQHKSRTIVRLKNYYTSKRQNIWWSTTSEPARSENKTIPKKTRSITLETKLTPNPQKKRFGSNHFPFHFRWFFRWTRRSFRVPGPVYQLRPRHSAQSILLPAKLGIKIHLFETETKRRRGCFFGCFHREYYCWCGILIVYILGCPPSQ